MDSPTDCYPAVPRLPLITLAEARDAVRILQHLTDGNPEGQQAGAWAANVALRLPFIPPNDGALAGL